MNGKKQTLSDWAFEFKLRLLDKKFYDDKNQYTYEEYKEIVPRNVEVAYCNENSNDNFAMVTVEDGQVIVANEIVDKIINFQKTALQMKLVEDELKQSIKNAMEENGIDKGFEFVTENGKLKVTYKKPYETTKFDNKKLKEDLPDIYEEYAKKSFVSSSISISIE